MTDEFFEGVGMFTCITSHRSLRYIGLTTHKVESRIRCFAADAHGHRGWGWASGSPPNLIGSAMVLGRFFFLERGQMIHCSTGKRQLRIMFRLLRKWTVLHTITNAPIPFHMSRCATGFHSVKFVRKLNLQVLFSFLMLMEDSC